MARKSVLITGGGKGLGREIAYKFAKENYNVFINYFQDEKSAKETESNIKALGGQAKIIQGDVGRFEEIEQMMDQLPNIDILVHNAVYAETSSIESISCEHWERALAVNASALLYLAQKVYPHMREQQFGRIFTISSIGASRAVPNYTSIGVSKATMEALIRYFAAEWASDGITANVISPGAMDTEAFRSVFPDPSARLNAIAKKTPAKKTVLLEEVADMILNYCQPNMGMVTGQVLRMDGGYSLTV
ncbi:SDR family oxidoreductase [Alkalihalobacterium elongatum]|uniref:SDR family oxidoreductase n=1 Tax=Alkalihalobacterium elongatum TaxID=2675466 RepID=UPI001C1F5D58|nr:SDR family oxidoreductase [Alkalihalobacterium elongatum]